MLREVRLYRSVDPDVARLYNYLRQLEYDLKYFKSEENDIESTLQSTRKIVFNLKTLREQVSEHLQRVLLILITAYLRAKLFPPYEPKEPRILVCDKAWLLLKTRVGALFLEDAVRTLRKRYCSLIVITQSLDDLLRIGEPGLTLIENAATLILFRHELGQRRELAEALLRRLTDEEIEELADLRCDEEYREVLVKTPGYVARVRLVVAQRELEKFRTGAARS